MLLRLENQFQNDELDNPVTVSLDVSYSGVSVDMVGSGVGVGVHVEKWCVCLCACVCSHLLAWERCVCVGRGVDVHVGKWCRSLYPPLLAFIGVGLKEGRK